MLGPGGMVKSICPLYIPTGYPVSSLLVGLYVFSPDTHINRVPGCGAIIVVGTSLWATYNGYLVGLLVSRTSLDDIICSVPPPYSLEVPLPISSKTSVVASTCSLAIILRTSSTVIDYSNWVLNRDGCAPPLMMWYPGQHLHPAC